MSAPRRAVLVVLGHELAEPQRAAHFVENAVVARGLTVRRGEGDQSACLPPNVLTIAGWDAADFTVIARVFRLHHLDLLPGHPPPLPVRFVVLDLDDEELRARWDARNAPARLTGPVANHLDAARFRSIPGATRIDAGRALRLVARDLVDWTNQTLDELFPGSDAP